MNRVRSIVVGVDFTPCSAAALKQATRIAEWNRADLHVVHVVEMLVAQELTQVGEFTQLQVDIHDGLSRDARAEWDAFRKEIPGAENLDLHLEIDHPLAAILRRVRQHNADLLILGSHGMNPDRGTGTLATACVRKAMTKVLLVRDPHTGPFQRVIACVDFSDTSRIAIQQAARIALQDGAVLTTLHVFQAPWNRLQYRVLTSQAPPDFERNFRDLLRRRFEEFVRGAEDEIQHLNPSCEVFDSSNYGDGIIQYAKDVAADLIVLGTRGATNFRYMLWGSTAERVVRSTPCSILTVKPPGFEYPLGVTTDAALRNPLGGP